MSSNKEFHRSTRCHQRSATAAAVLSIGVWLGGTALPISTQMVLCCWTSVQFSPNNPDPSKSQSQGNDSVDQYCQGEYAAARTVTEDRKENSRCHSSLKLKSLRKRWSSYKGRCLRIGKPEWRPLNSRRRTRGCVKYIGVNCHTPQSLWESLFYG